MMTPDEIREAVREAIRAVQVESFRKIDDEEWSWVDAMADAAIRAVLLAIREPSSEMWEAWRSVNCVKGDGPMQEFTYFDGDFGNWVACHTAMIDELISQWPYPSE